MKFHTPSPQRGAPLGMDVPASHGGTYSTGSSRRASAGERFSGSQFSTPPLSRWHPGRLRHTTALRGQEAPRNGRLESDPQLRHPRTQALLVCTTRRMGPVTLERKPWDPQGLGTTPPHPQPHAGPRAAASATPEDRGCRSPEEGHRPNLRDIWKLQGGAIPELTCDGKMCIYARTVQSFIYSLDE